MKILCVAEKPSIAKSLATILSDNNFQSRQGQHKYCRNFCFGYKFQGRQCDFTVTSVLGHLIETDFSKEYRKWGSCDSAELFRAPIVKSVRSDVMQVAKNLETQAKYCQQLIIWTDCDREGENIGQEIANVSKRSNPRIQVMRARFSVVQRREILKAINQLHQIDVPMSESVDARMELDLRIGAAFTRFQTMILSPQFADLQDQIISYGSCQFPTLGFVVERYWARKRFISEPFWYIDCKIKKGKQTVDFKWTRGRLFDKDVCLLLYSRCVDVARAKVISVSSSPQRHYRPLPLTTIELQKFATSYLKISGHEVMSIAEELYNQGFISYPRTETNVFEKGFNLHQAIEKQVADPKWGGFAQELMAGEHGKGGRFKWPRCGSSNDKAHPPIHPTNYTNNLIEKKAAVYEYIVRRFLACCSEDAIGQNTKVRVRMAEQEFEASGLIIKERNYLDVYRYDKWNSVDIPDFEQNEVIEPESCEMHQGQTTPPQLMSEAELIAVMDKNGIGTDATIAEHIKKVQEREYIYKDGQYFLPSKLGLALVEGYDEIGFHKSLAKPHLRRVMEQRMKDICDGKATRQQVVQEGVAMYYEMFEKTRQNEQVLLNALNKYLGIKRARNNELQTV
ncbi:hypothetical protein MIR68_006858 [Amoeboaphelidium protococcarum]|nr:hypothetical protein MIR68_006858 [Amoeboaphelidium protococcarum]